MANFFDQFDEKPVAASNFFDQFDQPSLALKPSMEQVYTAPPERLPGIIQGVRDVADKLNALGKAGNDAFPILKSISPYYDPDAALAKNAEASKEFEAGPGQAEAGKFGRTLGQQAVALPLTLGAGAAARTIGGAMGPIASKVASFLTGGGGIASNAVAGGEAGALNAALTGGDIKQGAIGGALTGGALKAAVTVPSYAYNAAKTVGNALTESGQGRIANAIVDRYAGPGGVSPNANELIPGSRPTLAEATGDVGIANLQRTARDQPGLGPMLVEREQANHAARNAYYDTIARTPEEIQAAKLIRDAEGTVARQQIFTNAQPADPRPVIAKIDEILADPGGKRSAVVSALKSLRKQFLNEGPNGSQSLETNAATLYQSGRKEIGDMMDSRMANTDPAGLLTTSELKEVRDTLDGVIDKAAPGFKQYLEDYSAASRPIDAMQFLQGLKLRDAQGNMTLAKVQTALDNIQKLKSAPGINKAKSLTDEHIDALTNLRDDLLRAQSVNAGKSLGSPTVQNALSQEMLNNLMPGPVGGILQHAADPRIIGSVLGSAAGHLVSPGNPAFITGGATAGGLTGQLLKSLVNEKNNLVKEQLYHRLLNPELYTSSGAGTNALLPPYLPALAAPAVSGRQSKGQ